MIDRLRFLCDRPLDPQAARAVTLLAAALLLGFGALLFLGAIGSSRLEPGGSPPAVARPRPGRPFGSGRSEIGRAVPARTRQRLPRQDPQDRPGAAARARAARELLAHRALQHVPYRRDGLSVTLAGARGGRAVLTVRAGTVAAARRGWRAFLRRHRDPGDAYLPVFVSRRRGSGGS
jgi:hypothetical protein